MRCVTPPGLVSSRAALIAGLALVFACLASAAFGASSAALGYAPKYRSDFSHFSYVNPDAPKGGTLVLPAFGTFDTLNPYALKGIAPDGLQPLVFEPLMVQSLDEPFSVYAHLARDIRLAADKLSVTFTLDTRAHFSDGSPVLAEDVRTTYEMMRSKGARPIYRFMWSDVKRAVVVSKRVIRFEFARANPELHMVLATMPVFSRKWVEGQDFGKMGRRTPIGSGPYIVGKHRLGKDFSYERNPHYWARDLPTRRGMYNFDRIVFKFYRDFGVMLEGLKAGEFDFMTAYNSKRWARDFVGPQFDSGRIIKTHLAHHNNAGMQGFVFNVRRPLFQDRRVRRAMSLAFDFEWSNRNLFYGQYVRNESYFSNSELAARGIPAGLELKILQKHRALLPEAVFNAPVSPALSRTPAELRANLIEAKRLLKEAGWHVQDGVLVNSKGEHFEFEFLLAQKGFERILAPYAHNLARLGIQMRYRTVDTSLYVRRMRTYQFDMAVVSYPQSQSPGNELYSNWHSRAATQPGSRNYMGVQDKGIDALIDELVYARNRKHLIAAARALDRAMLYGEYLVPNFYSASHRAAYWDKFERPATLPLYYASPEEWLIPAWWLRTSSPKSGRRIGKEVGR